MMGMGRRQQWKLWLKNTDFFVHVITQQIHLSSGSTGTKIIYQSKNVKKHAHTYTHLFICNVPALQPWFCHRQTRGSHWYFGSSVEEWQCPIPEKLLFCLFCRWKALYSTNAKHWCFSTACLSMYVCNIPNVHGLKIVLTVGKAPSSCHRGIECKHCQSLHSGSTHSLPL